MLFADSCVVNELPVMSSSQLEGRYSAPTPTHSQAHPTTGDFLVRAHTHQAHLSYCWGALGSTVPPVEDCGCTGQLPVAFLYLVLFFCGVW